MGKEINVVNYTKINDELRVLELLVYKPNVINDNYNRIMLICKEIDQYFYYNVRIFKLLLQFYRFCVTIQVGKVQQ